MEQKIQKRFLTKGLVGDGNHQPSFNRANNNNKSNKMVSLITPHMGEIRTYLKQNKRMEPYLEEDTYLDLLDAEYQKRINNETDDFDQFLKYLIKSKFQIVEQRKQSKNFLVKLTELKSLLKFPTLLKEDSSQKYIIPNLFFNEEFQFNLHSNQVRTMNRLIRSVHFDNKKRQEQLSYSVGNTSFYHSINLSAPTIGNIYISNMLPTSITEMMTRLCNGESANGTGNVVPFIPLHAQNMREDLVKMVLSKDSPNADFKRKILQNVIQTIDVTYDMLMKEKGKIKKSFIIPFRKNELSSNLNDDAPSPSSPSPSPVTPSTTGSPTNIGSRIRYEIAYDKYSSYLSPKDVIKHNLEILFNVLEMVKENPKNLDLPNVKDVLALFVYFAITLFYDAYYQYLMKISAVLYEYNEDPRFEGDDLQTGIKYIDEVIRSLKVYKKILLNNFYDLFLPSRLTKAYGIKVDDNGYIVCASKLAVDNEFLMKKYPFQSFESSKLAMDRDALQQVNHFLVGKQRAHDLYDPKETLYIGFYVPNEEKMKELSQFYRYLIQVLGAQFSFAILLDNLISKTILRRLPRELFKTPFEKIAKLGKGSNNQTQQNLSSNKDLNGIVMMVYKYLMKSYHSAKALKKRATASTTADLMKTSELREKEEQILLSTYYYNFAMILFDHIKVHKGLSPVQKNYLTTRISKAMSKVDRML
jgi:hypothetical protein